MFTCERPARSCTCRWSAGPFTLDTSRASAPDERTFGDGSLLRVERRDSLDNGTLIGLGAGIVNGWTFVRSQCGAPGCEPE